jgi:hypothetical protein
VARRNAQKPCGHLAMQSTARPLLLQAASPLISAALLRGKGGGEYLCSGLPSPTTSKGNPPEYGIPQDACMRPCMREKSVCV